MVWMQKFAKPIVLKDGRAIVTLADAHDLIVGLPEACQSTADWQFALELLQRASNRGEADSVNLARVQLVWAMNAEGLV